MSMPTPVSETERLMAGVATLPPLRGPGRWISSRSVSTVSRPPQGIASRALPIRQRRTCSRRFRAMHTSRMRSLSRVSSVMPAGRSGRTSSTTQVTTSLSRTGSGVTLDAGGSPAERSPRTSSALLLRARESCVRRSRAGSIVEIIRASVAHRASMSSIRVSSAAPDDWMASL